MVDIDVTDDDEDLITEHVSIVEKPSVEEYQRLASFEIRNGDHFLCFEQVSLRDATPQQRNDKEYVLSILEQTSGDEFTFASEELRADPEVLAAAIANRSNDHHPLVNAHSNLRWDRSLIIAAIRATFPNEVLFDAYSCRVSILSDADKLACEHLFGDREVMMEAIRVDKYGCLSYASDNLKADRDFVFEALQKGASLESIGPDNLLFDDRELVLRGLQNGHENDFLCLPDHLQADRELAEFALAHVDYVQIVSSVFFCLPEELRMDGELAVRVVQRPGTTLEERKQVAKEVYECVVGEAARRYVASALGAMCNEGQ